MSSPAILAERLKARIGREGPLTIADYMVACLHDPTGGYYATRPRIGEDGDFVTAPMISQMFGELLGLWAAEVWERMGRPAAFRLVELGPGDGTLMSDALRALRAHAALLAAAELWLVEPSRPLRTLQTERIAHARAPRWTDRLEQVPDGAPVILLANEVLDCLPSRQFVMTPSGWAERLVGLGAEGSLAFGLSRSPPTLAIPVEAAEAAQGAVLELSPAQTALAAQIGQRVATDGGAALLIDYGRDRFGYGDTLQAVRAHRKQGPLDRPGEADLTVHADFPAVAAAVRATGAGVTAILGQGAFLSALGAVQRAQALARANPERADAIGRQLARLVDPDQMGTLFKVMAIHHKGLSVPGFEGKP